MVGDRLTTDIAFGNINNMATILVHPFKTDWSNINFALTGLLKAE